MRLTIAVGSVAALSFAATFVLAPYAGTISESLNLKQFLSTPAKEQVAATKTRDCNGPFGRVLAALSAKQCQ